MDTTEWASGLLFPEGPIWYPDNSIILVEIARGTLTRVTADGEVEVVADCGGGPNGAAVGPDGKVYVCNNGGFEWSQRNGLLRPGLQPADYTGGSIQRVDVATGTVETLYDGCNGNRLRGPNDLVFDTSGGFWFTDHGKNRPRERDRGGLYYAKADGSDIREVVFPLDAPNGVGLSPDEDMLYVAETHQGRLYQWELSGPGEIAGYFGPEHRGTVLADPEGGPLFDSLAVDAYGNVCVATIGNGGITVVTPDGLHYHRPFPDPLTTNICFGGPDRTLAFVTLSGSGRLVSRQWDAPGLPLAYEPILS
ncbi:MAG: SMP-30/gluconolactonase/LRE family protein [Acidimicrobiales bacterium]